LHVYPDAWYVEGWAWGLDFDKDGWGLVFEHGWLEIGEDIIAPTLTDGECGKYFAGARYTKREIARMINGGGIEFPTSGRDPERSKKARGRWESYKRARDEALAYCAAELKASEESRA